MTSAYEVVERLVAARRDRTPVVLEGIHALKHAVRFGAEVEVVAVPDRVRFERLLGQLAPDVAGRLPAEVVEVDAAAWRRLAPHGLPSPALAVARRPAVDLAAAVWEPTARPVVLLEAPAHLGNVGAVVRVAAAASAAAVVVVGGADPWHPLAVRAGAGLQFALPVGRADAAPATRRAVVALDPGGRRLDEVELPAGAVLAFGTERAGLSPELLDRAAARVAIPMRDGVSSLNLATAVAVTVYAARWRLTPAQPSGGQ